MHFELIDVHAARSAGRNLANAATPIIRRLAAAIAKRIPGAPVSIPVQ